MWAIRERYAAGTGVRSNEGSAKEGSFLEPLPGPWDHVRARCSAREGSFSFGSSRVETNEKEVKARRRPRRKRARWVA